jgi:hypothetical protein
MTARAQSGYGFAQIAKACTCQLPASLASSTAVTVHVFEAVARFTVTIFWLGLDPVKA